MTAELLEASDFVCAEDPSVAFVSPVSAVVFLPEEPADESVFVASAFWPCAAVCWVAPPLPLKAINAPAPTPPSTNAPTMAAATRAFLPVGFFLAEDTPGAPPPYGRAA